MPSSVNLLFFMANSPSSSVAGILEFRRVQKIGVRSLGQYKATPPEQLVDVKPAEREKKTAPIEQIEKLEKEVSQVQESYTQAEHSHGSYLLNQVVAKGYLTKLLANEAVKSYIGRREPEILTHPELEVNTVSMEETVQLQVAEA